MLPRHFLRLDIMKLVDIVQNQASKGMGHSFLAEKPKTGELQLAGLGQKT